MSNPKKFENAAKEYCESVTNKTDRAYIIALAQGLDTALQKRVVMDETERLRKGIKNIITDIVEDDAKAQNLLIKLKALLA